MIKVVFVHRFADFDLFFEESRYSAAHSILPGYTFTFVACEYFEFCHGSVLSHQVL